jgi:coenzyme F420-reducing hydrogenase beta subunit
VCPKDAISIELDKNGFYRPYVDEEKCVECGLCEQVCYRFQEVLPTEDVDSCQNYAAAASDDDVVKKTTSGGIADLLCGVLIEQGYKCVGVVYDNETDTAVGSIAETRVQTIPFRGSKYIQSYSYPVFKRVVTGLKNDKVAVFGTPCQIYGLDLYLRKIRKRENFILIDLYCHGCPSMNVWKKYISDAKTKSGVESFDNVTFRSKVRGWGNFYVSAEKDNRLRFVSPKANDPFFAMFFSDSVLNDACSDCSIRGTVAHCDIRLGDFWGKKYDLNTRGVSLVTIASEKGDSLFNYITDKIDCTKHKAADFIPYQSWGKEYKVNAHLRKSLLNSLADDTVPLSETIKTYNRSLSSKQKVKKVLKTLTLQLPTPVISFAKRLYHKIVKI